MMFGGILLIDFSNCVYSDRHGSYGGMAGDKDGILFEGEYWIIKYPKSTKFMQGGQAISYVTSPLSEYLGSAIYNILGYDVHETTLGIRNGKLVVACKDFCKTRGSLLEIRTIKNAANRELGESLETVFHDSATGERVNLEELILHLQYNPILLKVPGIKERFWDCVVIDILIDNNDRNNGDWGILFDEETKGYSMAPVYDNGNAFCSKTDDNRIRALLKDDPVSHLLGSRTAYNFDGHVMSSKKIMRLDNPDLESAILRVVPKVQYRLNEIIKFFESIPNSYAGLYVCSDERRQFYLKGFMTRLEQLVLPRYNQLVQDVLQMNVF